MLTGINCCLPISKSWWLPFSAICHS